MVKNVKLLEKFEKERLKKEKVDVEKNFKIVEALYKEAVLLKTFRIKRYSLKDKVIFKIAKVVNSV